ncbi:hypothetical protein [Caulobacter mirabilis]|uniref:Uncharacterized protein n=1 Tax=Caulobacter mirabilis TaxID=69666 RepID=A0A2D2AWE1_9CAUL|nr:hypothetical protein [Caulobacter mirabilis]ATQ42291.1 hypothetical protein CSW64_07595 [Caulobacter mirabilis]
MLILTLAAVMAAATTSAEPTLKIGDPLAPARAGQLLCQTPDAANKSCVVLNHFDFAADGAIVNRIDARLSRKPWVGITMSTPVVVRDGAVCSPLKGVDKAEVYQDGKPADEATVARVRKGLGEMYAPYAGQEGCVAYKPGEGGLDAYLTVGKDTAKVPDRVIWVDPAAGWTTKP